MVRGDLSYGQTCSGYLRTLSLSPRVRHNGDQIRLYLAVTAVFLESHPSLAPNFFTYKMKILIIYLPKTNILNILADNVYIAQHVFLVHSNKYCHLLTNKQKLDKYCYY